jgi:hypothetical protein
VEASLCFGKNRAAGWTFGHMVLKISLLRPRQFAVNGFTQQKVEVDA